MGYLQLRCAASVALCTLLMSVQALPVHRSEPVKCQEAAGTVQSFPTALGKRLTQIWSRFADIEAQNARVVVTSSKFEGDWFVEAEKGGPKVCQGVGTWAPDMSKVALSPVSLYAVIAEAGGKPLESHKLLMVAFASQDLGRQVHGYHGNLSVTCSCDGGPTLCWNVMIITQQTVMEPAPFPGTLRRSRRSAVDTSGSLEQGQSHSGSSTPLLMVIVVAVVGLVALIAVLALCAGGTRTYDPHDKVTPLKGTFYLDSTTEYTHTSGSGPHISASSEVPKTENVTVGVEVESENTLVKNGAPASEQNEDGHSETAPAEGRTSPSVNTDSPPRAREASPIPEVNMESRVRSLSSRSQDPLPEIPTLETAGDSEHEETKEAEADQQNDGDNPYSYAVHGEGDRMQGSDSEEEGEGKEPAEASSNLPPYGKVTQPPSQRRSEPFAPETESYAEVREVIMAPLAGKTRLRSATDPLNPSSTVAAVRDTRSHTESATLLPLPAVPNVDPESESMMYDKIPEDVKADRDSQLKTNPVRQRKERLYESVDDIQTPEDTYESVPDDIKPLNSTVIPKLSAVPVPLPTRSQNLTVSPPSPRVPASPIPKKKEKELKAKREEEEKKIEKRELTKTVSDSESKKRTFSLFSGGRKKAKSVSAGVGKTRKERDQLEPLPDVPVFSPTSPHHLSPPPPPTIPAPLPPIVDEDGKDVVYDQPQLDIPKSDSPTKIINVQDSKSKSLSLPSSARLAGASIFNPRALPDLPEDSGSGTVAVHDDIEDDYDVVTHENGDENEDDEPGYETVNREEILNSIAENPEGIDPGYDKVRKRGSKDEGDVQEQEEGEDVAAVDEATPTDMRYAKVTKPSSPVEELAVPPDHDEQGYAVVPEEIKMRKRAMSSSKGIQEQVSSPVETRESVNQPETEPTDRQLDKPVVKKTEDERQSPSEEGTLPTTPASPKQKSDVDEQYATVDIAAKRASRKKKKEGQYHVEIAIRESLASTTPPPVPPIADLGDMEKEFHEPPIPAQSEGVHELMNTEPGNVARPGEHDYAEVDIWPDVPDVPYAKVRKPQKDTDDAVVDDDLGYDTVGGKLLDDSEVLKDKALGYDTVGDQFAEDESTSARLPTKSTIEQDMPTLELADPTQPETSQNLYDSLSPMNEHENEVEEQRYEEIDEETRENLRLKYKRKA